MERDRSIRLRSEETVAEPGRHAPPPQARTVPGHRARIITRSAYTKEAAMQTPLVFVSIGEKIRGQADLALFAWTLNP